MAVAARSMQQLRAPAPQPLRRRVRRAEHRDARKRVTIFALIAIPIALILCYVWLTAQLTLQTYRLHDDLVQQSRLVQQYGELRQRVATLESLPRLEAAATRLHMTVPPRVALVAPSTAAPPPPAQTASAASFAFVLRWFAR